MSKVRILLNVDQSGWNLADICCITEYTCGFSLTDRHVGGCRLNKKKTLVFCSNVKFTITSLIYNGSSWSRWQIHKSVGNRLLWQIYRKSLAANQWYRWKAYTPKGCFWGHSPPDIKNPKYGSPNPQKIPSPRNSFILSDLEKFTEFRGMIIFQIWAKWGNVTRKLLLQHGCLEFTHC